MPSSGTFTAVTAGTTHGSAIRSDGTVVCWGFDLAGETAAPEGTFTAVSAGDYRTCAVRTDGALVCWGEQPDGLAETSPPEGPFVSVSVGGDPGAFDWYACAIRGDGSAHCWSNEVTPYSSHSGPLSGAFASISTGSYQICTVDMSCQVSCTPHGP